MVCELEGNWKSGKAFDVHTVSSTYLGLDEFGHDRFENIRSEMGELVYLLKYKADRSVISRIVSLLDGIGGIEKFDYLIPIPPTKKDRPFQPVELITEALGTRRGVKVLKNYLVNTGNEELKGISDPVARGELLRQALMLTKSGDVAGKKVILVDDLYRSGATFNFATNLLYREGNASSVSVLAMTKTRSNR